MRTVKLIIGFEGTRYEGWQSQRKNDKTLQEIFEKILKKVLKEKTSVISSSRTDSGVHALGLVAHFKTQNPLPDEKIKNALNFYLPRDVVVHSAQTISDGFHARFQAKSKIYRYQIWNHDTRPLFERPFVLWHPEPLDISQMKKGAAHLVGRHDFSAFRFAGGEDERNPARTLKKISIRKEKHLILMDIEADGFLRHMVRIIVGTLMEVGRGKMAPTGVRVALQSKDRTKAGPTAKALGLTLVQVKY